MQLTPDLRRYFDAAGADVAASVAARVVLMADAVFPPGTPDVAPTVRLPVLGRAAAPAGVSARGAEVRMCIPYGLCECEEWKEKW